MEPIPPTPPAGQAAAASPAGPTAAASPAWPRAPRKLEAGRGASWWSEGWRVFTAAPLPWIAIIVVLFVINAALGALPVIGGLASMILWPVFSAGMLAGCHALAQGQPLRFGHLFAAFQSDRLAPLAVLGAIGAGIGLVLALVFGMLFFGTAGMAFLSSAMHGDAAMRAMMGMGAGALLGGLAALVLAALFMLAWWFAPALVMLNRAEPIDALKASF